MSETPPTKTADITAADIGDKLDELGSAAETALIKNQAKLISSGIFFTIAAIWVAHRLGKRRGRREA